jgi:hypothetical protein
MTEKYQFKDRLWDVVHRNSGKHIDLVAISADTMREARRSDKSLEPSTHQDEILNNAVWNVLDRHNLQPDDIDVVERQDKPKKVTRKSTGGRSCW